MSAIEKLDSVLEILNHSDAFFDEMFDAAKELLRDHGPAIRQAMIDARRYRWLRDTQQLATTSDWLGVYPADSRNCYYGPRLDAAIDARLASDSEGGE